MRKYLVLVSLFALTACGGGGGGGNFPGHAGYSTPGTSKPTINAFQGLSGGIAVNANNTNLTNMSSYTVNYTDGHDENDAKNAMIVYVDSHLGGLRGNLNRAASSRNRDVADPTEFALADAAITEMKQVLYDMVERSGDSTALRTYVTRHKNAVVNALKLQNAAVTDETSIGGLVAAFNTLKGNNSWTTENIKAELDAFDATNFYIASKTGMDKVRLKDTGEEGFFKFSLDDTGTIQSVALMEDPTSEYGSSWANKRIVIEDGVAVAVAPDETYGLNPFSADYLTDKAGVLVRDGTNFSNTVYSYEFNLGKYNEAGTGDHAALGFVSTMLQPDDLKKIEIVSETELTPAEAKAKLIEYIISKVNKKIHNQHEADNPDHLADAIAVVNWYIQEINLKTDEDHSAAFLENSFQGNVHQIAAMHGMGREEGVKLKYSDFGYASMARSKPDGTPLGTQYVTYVGGYDDRRMDNTDLEHNTLESGATFTGTAIVTVEDHHKNKTLDTESRNTALYKDTSAELRYDIVNEGTQAQHTLTLNNLKAMDGTVSTNSDWYSMVVQGTEGVDNMRVQFDSTGKTIDENYQFFVASNDGSISRNEHEHIASGDQLVNTTGATPMTVNMTNGTTLADEVHKMNGSATAEYYGQDEHNPTEATAGFWVDERWANDNNTIQHELSVYGAFGGQKDAE